LYPKVKTAELASVSNNTPVAPTPTEPAQTVTTAPQSTNPPQEEALNQAPVNQAPPPAEQPQAEQAENQASTPPPSQTADRAQTLPETASQWALLGLIGLLTIGAGGLLGLTGKRQPSENR
jgi:hypothetical protein